MPRSSRIVLPDCPHHIVQRGHNRQVVFVGDEDYRYYLENIKEWKTRLGCKVYAYCLMSNHVHLIVDPGKRIENLALFMKRVAGRQTRYVNKLERRTGTLWEGRYKSSPIKADEYLLSCSRYIELNPVRAGIVDEPEHYVWSSFRKKIGLEGPALLDLDQYYMTMGEDGYREWVKGAVPDGEWKMIWEAVKIGRPTGSNRFAEEISQKIGRRVELRRQGRPRKDKK